MKKSSCEVLFQYYPDISELEDFRSIFISNCVFSSFLCYITVMMNVVSIHAIRKTSSLPKTLKTLLLSLAVSDVAVGLSSEPLFIVLMAKGLKQNVPSCSTYIAFDIIMSYFCIASFLGVVTVSADRFLAIHLHLRYQELVTHGRVLVAVTSIWLLSVLFSLLMLWVPFDVSSFVIFTIGGVCVILTAMAYVGIYFVVRRHKNEIQVLQVQQASPIGEVVNTATCRKSAVGTFFVYLVFLACYLPHLVCLAAFEIYGSSIALKRFYLLTYIILFLNSLLNPVIYCWKMRHIRRAIMDILRNISWNRNHPSHSL